ncbi:hypothetical protein HA466_0014640 [Hirschfeldia incana]|nr:hypothetical protein HA466_0014640 [Hirschfeldia incana]
MKKTTQAFLLLRLLLLICLVFQVPVTVARRIIGRRRTFPSRPCRAAPRASGVTAIMNTQCRTIRRPPPAAN